MASALKRKRGTVEVLDRSKRSKSTKTNSDGQLPIIGDKVGWEAAFAAPAIMQELVQTNGINGHGINSPEDSEDAVDFESFLEEEEKEKQAERDGAAEKALRKALRKKEAQAWKISEPIAGRMINNDPVFTADEKFLILANRTTIHVYSTSNSLLTRSIKLKINTETNKPARIVTYCLSPTQANILWVACSDGTIYHVDWTTGAGTDQFWTISSTGCIHMTVASMESAGRKRDVVFTTEARKDGGWRITANELAPPNRTIKTEARTVYTSKNRVNFLKTAKEGSIIVAASEDRILIGRLRSTDYGTIDKIRYEFRVFESSDPICSLDVRVSDRPAAKDLKKAVRKLPVVDLVVGDVRGAIFLHNDLLAKLVISQDGALPPGFSITPRKLHWHRQAALTVKWSLDGNYVISGGTETVLVLWQLDTGKHQFLPHMSATIQNVVVSPSGSSYAVQLADNSAMVLSTVELEPSANIAGIQANTIEVEVPIEARVRRLEDEAWGRLVFQRTPAVINPVDPSRLLLAVGQMQEMRTRNPLVLSNPFLQTFDLGSGHNLSRQALTRTNITNINSTPSAHRLSEPRVTHMKISHDGNWLATVDEWMPPMRDLEFLSHQGKDVEIERQLRREVFLKFWQWNKENDTWRLVSRIDAPHTLVHAPGAAGRILDLAADPNSLRFSTVGEDNNCRIWSPTIRKRDGVVVRDKDEKAFRNWKCKRSIPLGKPELLDGPKKTSANEISSCLDFSDDGSVLAVACGSSQGLLHLVDTESGAIRFSHTGWYEGEIIRMEFLEQDLIILSDKLNVYDLCSFEMRSSIRLAPTITSMSTTQKREMWHMAVDRKSRTFAVSFPWFHQELEAQVEQAKRQSLYSVYSHTELVVFHQDKPEPLLKEKCPNLITTLLPTGSEGYLVLDTAAEIRTVLKKGTQAITALAQPTSALQLDVAEEPAGGVLRLIEDVDEDEEVEDQIPAPVKSQEEADDDNETPAITQQQLSEIFDMPSYALPPIENLFYQVAALCSGKPQGGV